MCVCLLPQGSAFAPVVSVQVIPKESTVMIYQLAQILENLFFLPQSYNFFVSFWLAGTKPTIKVDSELMDFLK